MEPGEGAGKSGWKCKDDMSNTPLGFFLTVLFPSYYAAKNVVTWAGEENSSTGSFKQIS